MAMPDGADSKLPRVPDVLPFVVSMDDGKADAATRKFIRSHAMRGRKQSRNRPRRNVLTHGCEMVPGSVQVPSVKFEDIMRVYSPPTRLIGTDLSFLTSSESLNLDMLSNIIQVSPLAQKVVYPLITAVGDQVDNRDWIRLCTTDPAALHVTAFSVEAFVDMCLHGREQANAAAMVHLQQGLKLLSARLAGNDEKLKTTDANIGVVLKLATSAHFAGDLQAERQHLLGVRKMVDSRGGLKAFKDSHLLSEILRCDLVLAIFSTMKPIFFRQVLEPIPSYPINALPDFSRVPEIRDARDVDILLDPGLAGAWSILRRFALLVNLGAQTQRLVSTKVINETMTSVTYRLLWMRFDPGSLDESLRLVLLTYCYHVFIQWQEIKLPCPLLQEAFRESVTAVQSKGAASARFILWMLMVGAVSIFDPQKEEWLNAMLRHHAHNLQRSWADVQDILKSFLWLPLLDGEPARSMWNSVVHSERK